MRKKQQNTEHEDSHYHITSRTCSASAIGEKHNKSRIYIYIYIYILEEHKSSLQRLLDLAGLHYTTSEKSGPS